ncbi:MAG TPA: hypothetical protein VN033_10200 [Vulgatibacter sp.]|nr:hypothetical protein [Vulgatibacter sp.]
MNLPMLDLTTPDGEKAPWDSLWQRKNLLVLVADGCPGCDEVLEMWSEMEDEIRAEDAEVVAVFDEDPGPLPGDPITLLDPDHRLADAIGVRPGTIVATDRYFEIQQAEPIPDGDVEGVVEDTLAWIDLAERRCDECGVDTWKGKGR